MSAQPLNVFSPPLPATTVARFAAAPPPTATWTLLPGSALVVPLPVMPQAPTSDAQLFVVVKTCCAVGASRLTVGSTTPVTGQLAVPWLPAASLALALSVRSPGAPKLTCAKLVLVWSPVPLSDCVPPA